MNQTKKFYQAPRLTVHGDAAQLTQATNQGPRIDRVLGTPITAGTPIQMS